MAWLLDGDPACALPLDILRVCCRWWRLPSRRGSRSEAAAAVGFPGQGQRSGRGVGTFIEGRRGCSRLDDERPWVGGSLQEQEGDQEKGEEGSRWQGECCRGSGWRIRAHRKRPPGTQVAQQIRGGTTSFSIATCQHCYNLFGLKFGLGDAWRQKFHLIAPTFCL